MTVNAKFLLSGLDDKQLDHPSVKKILATLKEEYINTGQGIRTIRWVEETYNIKVL